LIVVLRSYITLRYENKRSPPTTARPLQFCPTDTVFFTAPEGDAHMINDMGKHQVKQ